MEKLAPPARKESLYCRHPCCSLFIIFVLWRCDPSQVMASSFLRFLNHTQQRTTVGRTPLDEWSARRRDLYLTPHNTHNKETSMAPVEFEPTISAGEQPQTHALDRAAIGTGFLIVMYYKNLKNARKAVTKRRHIHKGHKKILISETNFTICSRLFLVMSN